MRVRRGTVALLHQVIDLALYGPDGSANQNDESETLWSLIEDIFTTGDATPQPSRDGNTSPGDLPLSQPSSAQRRGRGPRQSSWNGSWVSNLAGSPSRPTI